MGCWHVVPPAHAAPMGAQPSYGPGAETHVPLEPQVEPSTHVAPAQHGCPKFPHAGAPPPLGTQTASTVPLGCAHVLPLGQPPPLGQRW
jgi:hypothetical protein